MGISKYKIENINVEKLFLFFKNSHYNGDQTIDIVPSKFYCKASNNSKTNILYREITFDSSVKVTGKEPEHIKFFIQNYDLLNKVVGFMRSESVLDMTLSYEDDICKKITFTNSKINYDIFASMFGLAVYIEDEKWNKIKSPLDPVVSINIGIDTIKEIKNLHKLSKKDTEKLDVMQVYSSGSNIIFKHESANGGVEFSFDSDNGLTKNELKGKWVMNLDLFGNIDGYAEFLFQINTSGGLIATYLTNGNNIININSLTNA